MLLGRERKAVLQTALGLHLKSCPAKRLSPSLSLLLISLVTESFELVSVKRKRKINYINQNYYLFTIEIVLRTRSVDKYPEPGNSNTRDKQASFLCLLSCDRLQ